MKYFLLTCLSVFILASCSTDKEPFIYENKYEKLSPEEYLKTYTTPEIMFHYMEVNENSKTADGLLIDNKGRVFQYSNQSIDIEPESLVASISTLVRLLTHSVKTDKTVDVAQLVENYKMTRKVDVNLLDTSVSTQDKDFYFSGYDVAYDAEGNETCSAVGVSSNVYVQKIFKSTNFINKSSYASKIVKWMATMLDKSDA
ncbi:MAG: hypothetical protein HKN68_09410 [Saprospiraceae bacterium]|nr:hypothetical protein [Saprospiraceae bacterium]